MDTHAREHMLFGGWRSGVNFQALDIQMISGASRYVAYDGTVSEADGSCVWDREKTLKYLGAAVRIALNGNQGTFVPNKFGEGRIMKESMLYSVQSDSSKANYTGV